MRNNSYRAEPWNLIPGGNDLSKNESLDPFQLVLQQSIQ